MMKPVYMRLKAAASTWCGRLSEPPLLHLTTLMTSSVAKTGMTKTGVLASQWYLVWDSRQQQKVLCGRASCDVPSFLDDFICGKDRFAVHCVSLQCRLKHQMLAGTLCESQGRSKYLKM